jgi:hypothetical protein
MPADAQLEITDLVCRFVAESDLEHELAAHADPLRGLARGGWGFGHPRGAWGYTSRRFSRAAATRGCVSSAPGRAWKRGARGATT